MLAAVLLVGLIAWPGVAAPGATTTRVSVASDGTQGDGTSSNVSISADGRFVAFYSTASNLVTGDTNGAPDVFVRDTTTGTTSRVSVASDGTQGNGDSITPAISADGRYVAFESRASNLVPDDSSSIRDIFVHDTLAGTTTRVSVASDGTEANFFSFNAAVSGDGRHVAFESSASNLVAGDSNGVSDVFLHDTATGTTTRVSVASDGTQGNASSGQPAISADGHHVAFESLASTLASDTNPFTDVFLHDARTATTTLVSVDSDSVQPDGVNKNPAIDAEGRRVAFDSTASLVAGDGNGTTDVFVRDTATGTTTGVTVATGGAGTGDSFLPSISADGRHVAFQSRASDLVDDDSNGTDDVFLHDTATVRTWRVSLAADGTEANDASSRPALNGDGRYVAFHSVASNLVAGDTNGVTDVFVRDTAPTDLAITKTAAPAKVAVGDQLTYTITVTNQSTQNAATAVTVWDTLPLGVEYVSDTDACTLLPGTGPGGEDQLDCALGPLAPGATVSFEVVVQVVEAGTLANTATVEAPEIDPDPTNDAVTSTTVAALKIVDLIAAQHIDVGEVEVWRRADPAWVTVTYVTDDGWCLTETHLAVGDEVADIPQTRSGHPVPGQFAFAGEHVCVTEVTYTVPSSDPLVVAAQAVVVGPDDIIETAWGEGQPFTRRGPWGMWFDP